MSYSNQYLVAAPPGLITASNLALPDVTFVTNELSTTGASAANADALKSIDKQNSETTRPKT